MAEVIGSVAAILFTKVTPPAEFRGVWAPVSTEGDPSTLNGPLKYYNSTNSQWETLVGTNGNPGTNGTSSFVYRASADDPNGLNFTYPQNQSQAYVGWVITDTEIVTPAASDFSGRWEVRGNNGLSVYLYQAWANDKAGTGFTVTPVDPDNYLYTAFVIDYAYIAPGSLTASYFAGKYFRQKGAAGNDGLDVIGAAFNGNDIEFELSDTSKVVLVNAKQQLQGPSGNGNQMAPNAFVQILSFDDNKITETVQSAAIAFTLDQTYFIPGAIIVAEVTVDGNGFSFGADFQQMNAVVPSTTPGARVLFEFKAYSTSNKMVYYNIYNV